MRGLPTAYAAPVARAEFAVSGDVPVWACARGDVVGRSVEPLYRTAPEAAKEDEKLYAWLALFDMLRGGRARERKFAEQKLDEAFA